MARVVFPYAAEQAVILHFLLGGRGTRSLHENSSIVIDGKRLRYDGTPSMVVDIAWYDDAGSLQAVVPVGILTMAAPRVFNVMLGIVGSPDTVEREVTEIGKGLRFVFAGSYIDMGQAFTLMGPLGLKAWRSGYVHDADNPAHKTAPRSRYRGKV
jgi:hypothetical protein